MVIWKKRKEERGPLGLICSWGLKPSRNNDNCMDDVSERERESRVARVV
jgi:hypothetical protein